MSETRRFVFDSRIRRGPRQASEYALFSAASVVPFGIEGLRLRMKLDTVEHAQHVALQLAAHGRLCVLLGRDGLPSKCAIPREPEAK